MDNFSFSMSLSEITSKLRNFEIKAKDLIDICLDNHNPRLNAYREWRPDISRKQAADADLRFANSKDCGLLQGIPISIKDIFGVDGMATYAGSPAPLPDIWQHDGLLIKKIREQAGVFVGKSHTVEFAFGGLGINNHWGTPRNPWDKKNHRVPGGSSSGAGVTLLEGSALVALGSDTAGSVRIPASITGNVGLKTTYDRWPTKGIFPLSPSLDSIGILTRTVADAVLAFLAIDPKINKTPNQFLAEINKCTNYDFTIGYGEKSLWEDCDPGIAECAEDALNCLSRHGIKSKKINIPEIQSAIEILNIGSIVAPEIDEILQSFAPNWLNTLDPVVSSRIIDGGKIEACEYLRRKRKLHTLSLDVENHFQNCTVIASPTVALSPPVVDEIKIPELYSSANIKSLRNTCPANYLNLCAITIPVGLDKNNMPVGLQLMGQNGQDEQLLAIANYIEKLIGKSVNLIGLPT